MVETFRPRTSRRSFTSFSERLAWAAHDRFALAIATDRPRRHTPPGSPPTTSAPSVTRSASSVPWSSAIRWELRSSCCKARATRDLLRPGDQASETCIKPILRSVASSSSARIIGPPTCCSKSRLLTNELLLSVRERGREEREVQFRDVLPGQLPNCCPIGCGRGDICINGRCEDG